MLLSALAVTFTQPHSRGFKAKVKPQKSIKSLILMLCCAVYYVLCNYGKIMVKVKRSAPHQN